MNSRSDQDLLLAWDEAYQKKGSVWKGAPAVLPPLSSESRILELGCGNGKTLSAMLSRSWKLVALDLSLEAVRLSQKCIFGSLNLDSKAWFVVGDGTCLPFKDASFDAVFAFHVVGHVLEEGRSRIASEVARVLATCGRLFFLDFGRKDMRFGKGMLSETNTFLRGDGILTHYFSEEEVSCLFHMLSRISTEVQDRQTRIRGQDFIRSEVSATFVKI